MTTSDGGRGHALLGRIRSLSDDVRAELADHDLTLLTAALTFYAAVAVVPLMLVALYLAGLLIGADTVMRLGERVVAYAPEELGLRGGLAALRDIGPRLGLASFVAALIPATTYGEGLLRAFARFEPGDVPRKSLRGRILSVVLLATFPLLTVLGLFALAAASDVLGTGLAAQVLGVYLSFLFGWAVTTAVVAVIYGAFGARRPPLRPLLWGAAGTGSFLSGMSLGWLAVLQFGIEVGAAYGGSDVLGRIVLVVVYLYLVQFVLLVGYVVMLVLARRAGSRGSASGS